MAHKHAELGARVFMYAVFLLFLGLFIYTALAAWDYYHSPPPDITFAAEVGILMPIVIIGILLIYGRVVAAFLQDFAHNTFYRSGKK